ncbi:hypothetical protein Dsin_001985 [Dipteronia sinensis]|uniref:RNase H type-1 domain-containing protein n=1 Tax=Dipteronia sinensis TaxID=43782 RepID=A0AAE0B6N7_9ROSI|nr:hypothetical protein Dsin_001985 [Dipteronia sinensis]
MEEGKDAFYVVRKGDVISIYKTLHEFQSQVGFSVRNPSVTVYKGYGLLNEIEDYLASHGLKNSIYSTSADDIKEDLFGKLVPSPFQIRLSSLFLNKVSPPKRLKEAVESDYIIMLKLLGKLLRTQSVHILCVLPNDQFCILEFDGASKGNPGQVGAGAVLRVEDGSVVWRIHQGEGIAANNVAEYRALILGLNYTLQNGFKHIRVHGDSMLVSVRHSDAKPAESAKEPARSKRRAVEPYKNHSQARSDVTHSAKQKLIPSKLQEVLP